MAAQELTPPELEIRRTPWQRLRVMGGMASEVPGALRALLDAKSREEATAAYWQLDNRVLVQGNLFEAAEYVVPVLLAALLEDRPRHVKASVAELLFQIVAGDPDPTEVAVGNADLAERCRLRAREGIPNLYRLLIEQRIWEARDVLERIDSDSERLSAALAAVGVARTR